MLENGYVIEREWSISFRQSLHAYLEERALLNAVSAFMNQSDGIAGLLLGRVRQKTQTAGVYAQHRNALAAYPHGCAKECAVSSYAEYGICSKIVIADDFREWNVPTHSFRQKIQIRLLDKYLIFKRTQQREQGTLTLGVSASGRISKNGDAHDSFFFIPLLVVAKVVNFCFAAKLMTRLSVNINKIATIRNARGGNNPDIVKVALDCERFGAEGITVHPRPDERHIRHADVPALKSVLTTEFNIEGYPSRDFIDLVIANRPAQVTLVPDSPEQITSNAGWDTERNLSMLTDIVKEFQSAGIRTSLFVGADVRSVEYAAKTGADRVELYTEPYASAYLQNREAAVAPFVKAAEAARECGLGLNAGHDLSLINLAYLKQMIPWMDEVSIGHALVCDALYFGLETTIRKYKQCLTI